QYVSVAGQCTNSLYNDTMTIDGGGISPFGGEISPLFQVFGTKWTPDKLGATFNQGQPPAIPSGVITFSFMPNNVSLAAKEAENGGGANIYTTAISSLPGNDATCKLEDRIRDAFRAWAQVANVEFTEVQEDTTAPVPFGSTA